MPSLALFGSTGAVGGQVLRAAAALPAYDRVHEVGRRSAELGDGKVSFQAVDFEAIDKDEALRKLGPDVVISALGTTRAQAGSAAQFRKIDHDYVVEGARALRDASKQQRLIYCSVRGRAWASIEPATAVAVLCRHCTQHSSHASPAAPRPRACSCIRTARA